MAEIFRLTVDYYCWFSLLVNAENGRPLVTLHLLPEQAEVLHGTIPFTPEAEKIYQEELEYPEAACVEL